VIHGKDSSRFGCRADSNIVGNFVKKIIVYFLFLQISIIVCGTLSGCYKSG